MKILCEKRRTLPEISTIMGAKNNAGLQQWVWKVQKHPNKPKTRSALGWRIVANFSEEFIKILKDENNFEDNGLFLKPEVVEKINKKIERGAKK